MNISKQKKNPGDIIILHKCTKNHDHPLYCSRDGAWRMQLLFSVWAIIFPFTSLTAQIMKISKQWKKILEISFYTSAPQIMIICFTVPEIWHMSDVIVIFHLPPNSPKNENFTKIKANTWRYHHLSQVYQKSWSYALLFLRYGAWQM